MPMVSMRAVALLLVGLLLAAGAPRAASAATAPHRCCCPPGTHAAPAGAPDPDGPRITRRCSCDAKPAPAHAPRVMLADVPLNREDAALVSPFAASAFPSPLRRAPAPSLSSRAPPPPRSLFLQRTALLV